MIKIFNKKFFSIVCVSIVMLLIIIFPEVSSKGVANGLITSTNVIIPSLFPFTVCVLFLVKSQIGIKNKLINSFTYNIFGLSFNMFLIFLLSLIGGYPIGAKLISEQHNKKMINKKAANIMLNYCVNAGPAFIIFAVGIGVFSSYKLGIILYLSHILYSIITALTFSKKLKLAKSNENLKISAVSLSESIVTSISDAAAVVLQICSFVVLFSALNSYLEYFFKDMPTINRLSLFIEVTNGISKTDNLIFASFLLGFSGISIWFQIFSIAKKIKINYLSFVLSRFLHGTISSILTFIMLKLLKIKATVFSSGTYLKVKSIYSDAAVTVSLAVMLLFFLIFIYSKNCSRKFTDDVI